VGPPSVYPDDRDGPGPIPRGVEDHSAIDDVIFRANIDKFFGVLPSGHGDGTWRVSLPKQESGPQKSEHRKRHGKQTPCRPQARWDHSLPPSKGSRWPVLKEANGWIGRSNSERPRSSR